MVFVSCTMSRVAFHCFQQYTSFSRKLSAKSLAGYGNVIVRSEHLFTRRILHLRCTCVHHGHTSTRAKDDEHKVIKNVSRTPAQVNGLFSDVISNKENVGASKFIETSLPSALEKCIKKFTPDAALPYVQLMRLDKPTGVWLLLWPCYWSIAAATAPGVGPDLTTLALFGAGAVLMRGAGCTVNDIVDRKYDAQIRRTANRPIASGQIDVKDAIVFLAAQAGAAALILATFDLNRFVKLINVSMKIYLRVCEIA